MTEALLPFPAGQGVALADAPADKAAEIRQRMAEVDLTNTQSIITFGSAAQAELQVISPAMLAGVKNKDVGPAGDALREIVTTLRGFASEELDLSRERSWWDKLTGQAAPIAKFVARYEEVQSQIDRITENLLKHEHTLLKDIKALDLLYEKTLRFYDELALYIAAGEAKLDEADKITIPAKEAEVAAAAQPDQINRWPLYTSYPAHEKKGVDLVGSGATDKQKKNYVDNVRRDWRR